MKYVTLNNTDLAVSRIALGTDVYGATVNEAESFEMLDFFTQNGGTVIDTAAGYSDWFEGEKSRSEKLIGRWLENKSRENVIISTKGGFPCPDTPHISRLSPSEIRADIEGSLKRLKTDYIDIYWLHRDDTTKHVDELVEVLHAFVKEGKTRYIGMSNWTHDRIDKANSYAKAHNLTSIVASQIQYSIAYPNQEKNDPTLVLMNESEYRYMKENKMNVFAFASQAKGFFSKMEKGGMKALSQKAQDRYFNEQSVGVFERLLRVSENTGYSVGQLVTATLCNNRDFITIPIVGCKNISQLRESMSGADICLSGDIIRYITGK